MNDSTINTMLLKKFKQKTQETPKIIKLEKNINSDIMLLGECKYNDHGQK